MANEGENSSNVQGINPPVQDNINQQPDAVIQQHFPTLGNSTMTEFNPDSDQWVLYQERLENFFEACSVTDLNRKKVLLLNSVGPKAYKLVRDLSTPNMPTTKTYEELCKMLNQYYTPPVVAFRERKQFYAATKERAESNVEWMARIKFLAASCNFGNKIEGVILDKFVTGLDGGVFDRLCEEETETLTLTRAMDLAAKYEIKSQKTEEVNAVRPSGKKGKSSQKLAKSGPTTSSIAPSKCKHCGYKNHTSDKCKFKTATCHNCKKEGHLASICKERKINNVSDYNASSLSLKDNVRHHLGSIYWIKTNLDNSICAEVKVNDILHDFMLDSGASVSAIPFNVFTEKFQYFELSESELKLQAYTGHNIDVIGQFHPEIRFNDKVNNLKLLVVDSDGPSILGRDFLRRFGISFAEINSIKSNFVRTGDSLTLEGILTNHSSVFEKGVGKFKHKQVHLSIDDNVNPIFCKPRQVPHAFKAQVEAELERLEQIGVITSTETSSWGTPLVPILKPDGNIRICADYKVTVNRHLVDNRHPLPRVEEIFNALQGGCSFSKLDLESAYNQLELDESSRKLVAWTTSSLQGLQSKTIYRT